MSLFHSGGGNERGFGPRKVFDMKLSINYGPSANNTTISFASAGVIFDGVNKAFERLRALGVLQQVEVVRASPGYVTEETDGGKWGFFLDVVVLHGKPLASPKSVSCEQITVNEKNPSSDLIARQIVLVIKATINQLADQDEMKLAHSKQMRQALWNEY